MANGIKSRCLGTLKAFIMNEILEYLAELYNEIGHRVPKEKQVQLLALIIDIKRDNPQITNSKNSLYLDVKKFISAYLHNKKRKDFGYEDYDYRIIRDYILNSGFNDEQKFKLLLYTRNLLSSLSYEYDWIEKDIKRVRLKLAYANHKFKWILLLSSWNPYTLLASILIIFALECLLLLPAPAPCMAVCTVIPVHYSDCSFFNHILNVLSLHFDCIENSAKIQFYSWGIVGLVLWNMIYIIVCVNFLFKNLFSNFEVDD